ncbi:hypothetical protein ACLBKS_14540 [Hylemonella sp. W303a]|uniref:hypothetical protein n=1 Tax=Hylemonella sp. W303a TaxID=3389873 RepID=UPI00396B0663
MFQRAETERQALLQALGLGVLLSLAALLAAWLTRDHAIFSLLPPGGTVPDMRPEQRFDLHATFFTIWVTIFLVTPALCLFPFIRGSALAWRYWRAFWTVSMLAFAVHFYWAVVLVFGNDWSRILNTPRVSAPRLDTVFAVWWVLDVLLAWFLRSDALWVRAQRLLVHLLAFILFFMGAAREGELLLSRAIGYAMAAAVLVAVLLWLWRLRPGTRQS